MRALRQEAKAQIRIFARSRSRDLTQARRRNRKIGDISKRHKCIESSASGDGTESLERGASRALGIVPRIRGINNAARMLIIFLNPYGTER